MPDDAPSEDLAWRFSVTYELMSVDRLRPDGSGIDTLLDRNWLPGWTIFAPLHIGEEPYEVAYKGADGTAAIDHIW